MAVVVNAVYENGVLRPLEALPLVEHQCVSVIIADSTTQSDDDLLDHEFLRSLEGEHLPEVNLEEVHKALAKIPGSMTADFIAGREERF